MPVYRFQTVGLPEPRLAYANKLYLSPQDYSRFVEYGDVCLVLDVVIFKVDHHVSIQPGQIGIGKLQREACQIPINMPTTIFPMFQRDITQAVGVKFKVDLIPGMQLVNEIDPDDLRTALREAYDNFPLSVGVIVPLLKFPNLKFTALSVSSISVKGSLETVQHATFHSGTDISFTATSGTMLLSEVHTTIFQSDFSFENLGIGGLSNEFGQIFRRAFQSRLFPPKVARAMGLKHVKGMVLYGPPGTGKTLIARQISKFLNCAEPKIVNGPEILNKFVGQSEENVRNLFVDAEKEQAEKGEASRLHIIILDEFDAIVKQRGSGTGGGTGVGDTVVNQLLSKIDGVNALNNVLLIGMTNRIDMLDEAILRPGRMEVKIEITLPDENGRFEILTIHTAALRKNQILHPSVDMKFLARKTSNFSGAELEGLVRSAVSFAANRVVTLGDVNNLDKIDFSKVIVTIDDFTKALGEVIPQFGDSGHDLDQLMQFGICPFAAVNPLLDRLVWVTSNARKAAIMTEGTVDAAEHGVAEHGVAGQVLSVVIHGEPGAGCTALAAHAAKMSGFPFVRVISPASCVGMSDVAKLQFIQRIFSDAHKSRLACVIIDGLEKFVDYTPIGQRFSSAVLSGIGILASSPPPKGRSLLTIITAKNYEFLEASGFAREMDTIIHVPLIESSQSATEVVMAVAKDHMTGRVIARHMDLLIEQGKMLLQIPVKKLCRVVNDVMTHSKTGDLTALKERFDMAMCNLAGVD